MKSFQELTNDPQKEKKALQALFSDPEQFQALNHAQKISAMQDYLYLCALDNLELHEEPGQAFALHEDMKGNKQLSSLLSLLLFAVKLGWLPVAGLNSWKHWILPIAANSMGFIAVIVRMTRTNMLEVIRADYVRTARSKGLKERVVIWKHAFPNALIPIVTIIGTQLSFIMAGSIIVETIFSIPGMGTYIMTGINSRDYPIIMGTVVLLSLSISCMNLIVDIVYAFIDPRIKAQYETPRKRKARAAAPRKAAT